MNTLILILLPLIISGLGFLTYKHPPVARQILNPFRYVVLSIFFLLTFYNMTRSNAYYKAISVTYENVYKPQISKLNIDSLKRVVHKKDSINLILLENQENNTKNLEILKNQNAVQDSIRNNIKVLIEKDSNSYYNYLLYCFFALVIIYSFIGLSLLFDNIHNKPKVNNRETTDQAT